MERPKKLEPMFSMFCIPLWGWFHPSSNSDIWMFISISGWLFFINVPTWHDHQKVLKVFLFQLYIHFIDRECQWLFREFRLSLFRIEHLWQQERPLPSLVYFQVFCLSPCTTCFVLIVMGLGLKFCAFSL